MSKGSLRLWRNALQMFSALEFSARNLTMCLGFRLDSDDEFSFRTCNIGTACFF